MWVIVWVAFSTSPHLASQSESSHGYSLETTDRLEDEGWWPTKGVSPRKDYAGDASCRFCHEDIAAQQKRTSMHQAAMAAGDSTILRRYLRLSSPDDALRYSFEAAGTGIAFLARDSTTSASEPVSWAIGAGEIGQTYLLENDSHYTESRLSFYSALGALDRTSGQSAEQPADPAHGLGQRLTAETARQCFSCHFTAPIASGILEPAKATPGITCEACHGPGASHAAEMAKQPLRHQAKFIMDPASLSPSDSVDFCGACHRSWADVAMLMPANLGTASLRFQPYRLEKSRCWGKAGDERITCVACHDPHAPLVHDSIAYDNKCKACHGVAGVPGHGDSAALSCKKAVSNCVSCHMPKYEVPQTHAKFTDHDIRIVRAGEAFPL